MASATAAGRHGCSRTPRPNCHNRDAPPAMTATTSLTTPCAATARAALLAIPGVAIVDVRDPDTGFPVALVQHRVRCLEVTSEPDGSFGARFFLYGDAPLPLMEGGTLAQAYCAVADLLSRIGHLPAAPWTEELEAAERAAVAEVAVLHRPAEAEAAQLPLPALVH